MTEKLMEWIDNTGTLVTGESCPTTIEGIPYIELRGKLSDIERELLEAADFIMEMSLLFTAPNYSDLHPELSGIFSAASEVDAIARSIGATYQKEGAVNEPTGTSDTQ